MCADERFRVKTGRFEGPLDLMYTLARREELGLEAVEVSPLAHRIHRETRARIHELGTIGRWARLMAGVMAAKARALTPHPVERPLLEEDPPPRDGHLAAATRSLAALERSGQGALARRGEGGRPARPERVVDLLGAYRRLRERRVTPRAWTPPAVRAQIGPRIAELESLIEAGPVLLFAESDPPAERVRSLLAGLVMVHAARADLVQEAPFAPIVARKRCGR